MKQIKNVIPVLVIVIIWIKSSYSLPVELSYFSAAVNLNNVTLMWGTAAETNNIGFHVERKKSDSSIWVDRGFVAGNGTTTKPHDYPFDDLVLNIGTYDYRLKQVDSNGTFEYYVLNGSVIITTIGINTHEEFFADKFTLFQNYPNPFNPETKIKFDITQDVRREMLDVRMIIYDALGKEVATLVNEKLSPGSYEVDFDGSNLPSGIYFYTLGAGKFTKIKRMMLLK